MEAGGQGGVSAMNEVDAKLLSNSEIATSMSETGRSATGSKPFFFFLFSLKLEKSTGDPR